MSGQTGGRLTKHQRQHLITKLLESQPVASQAQLVVLLAEQGVEATQTTVSRDLDDLGAIKVRLPGGDTAYALPELPSQQIAPEDHLRRVLGEWVVEVAHSANLVVLRTPPGSAHVVGSALDRSGVEGVVGTVAGDDTVLVVVDEERRRWHDGPAPARCLGDCRCTSDRVERKGSGLRWQSGWCWPTAAASTRRWRCDGSWRTRVSRSSPWRSTSVRRPIGAVRTGMPYAPGPWPPERSRRW